MIYICFLLWPILFTTSFQSALSNSHLKKSEQLNFPLLPLAVASFKSPSRREKGSARIQRLQTCKAASVMQSRRLVWVCGLTHSGLNCVAASRQHKTCLAVRMWRIAEPVSASSQRAWSHNGAGPPPAALSVGSLLWSLPTLHHFLHPLHPLPLFIPPRLSADAAAALWWLPPATASEWTIWLRSAASPLTSSAALGEMEMRWR